MVHTAEAGPGSPTGRKLPMLGIEKPADLDAFWKLVKITPVARGAAIVRSTDAGRFFVVLLDGLARMSGGARHVYRIHHPGDFLGLTWRLYPDPQDYIEVRAVTDCSVGSIDEGLLEQAMQHHPALGQVLWRAAMMEATLVQQRLTKGQQKALTEDGRVREPGSDSRDATDATELLSRWEVRVDD